MRIISIIITLLFGVLSASALDTYTVAEVPNVHSRNNLYVTDPNRYLDSEQTEALNARLTALERTTHTQMAIVILPSIGNEDPMQFATDLAHTWGVGSKEGDNGVMLLMVMEDHAVRLQVGYGLEGTITDAKASYIVNDIIIPAMREDNLYGALSETVEEVMKLTASPELRKEMEQAEQKARNRKNAELRRNMLTVGFTVAFICLILAVWKMIVTGRKSRRIKRDNYQKAQLWRSQLITMGILAVMSGLTALPLFLITLYKYRRWRTRRIVCPNCGGKMRRLNEEEDNAYLTHGQDTEEKLGTVDYDVWHCPACGSLERFPFYARQNKFTPCPRCGAIAYGLDSERILRKPTATASGEGERIRRCRSCGHADSERFRIKPDDSAATGAFIAGAALGALSRGHGSSGFGGGGSSWGGGGFGGGGAGGSW